MKFDAQRFIAEIVFHRPEKKTCPREELLSAVQSKQKGGENEGQIFELYPVLNQIRRQAFSTRKLIGILFLFGPHLKI